MLRIVVFCIGLMVALPAAWAVLLGPDWEDCQGEDADRSIRGCTEIISKGLETNHDLAEAYSNRGVAYVNKEDYDRDIADQTKAIELNPDYADAYYNRGVAYHSKHDYDRAIADYSKASELNPNDPDSHINRCRAYNEKGEYDKAIADCSNAIVLNPKKALAYDNRGVANENKGDHDRAIADYRRALELDRSIEESKEGLNRLGASPTGLHVHHGVSGD